MKIITLCGSLKFKKEMMMVAEVMALKGNCILTPVYPVIKNHERTDKQLRMLKEAHFKRIELSDAILVINIDNYIGNSTNLEIEYAKKLGKEIIFYTDLIKEKGTDNMKCTPNVRQKSSIWRCILLCQNIHMKKKWQLLNW